MWWLTSRRPRLHGSRFHFALHGIHAVVGTTGFDDDDMDALRCVRRVGCQLPDRRKFCDFSGADDEVAAEAAALFDTAEIIELHHDEKIDVVGITCDRENDAARGAAGQMIQLRLRIPRALEADTAQTEFEFIR